jgi:pyruvate kinase
MYRGVYPVSFKLESSDIEHLYQSIFKTLLSNNLVEEDDLVIFTKGDLSGVSGGTNSMKIVRVTTSE